MNAVVGLGALGEEVSLQPLVTAWLEGLMTLPRAELALEAGRDARGRYLRAWGPSPLLSLVERGAQLDVRALPDDGAPRGPDPRDPAFAPGRIVWFRNAGSPAPGPMEVSTDPAVSWGIQGLFRTREEGVLAAHVRMAAAGPATVARRVCEEVGVRTATLLGGIFEPWEPGSVAATVAGAEWSGRKVVRFHSGVAPPPDLSSLAAPWNAPPAFAPIGGGSSWWRLGWPWRGPFLGLASDREMVRHMGVLGMTGSGKTQYLAHLAAEATSHGVPFALFDLHGDLGPAALSSLGAAARERVIVIDGSRPWGEGRAGVDVLEHGDGPEGEDLAVAEVLSALRPVGGTEEEFWGPRLERILGSTLRAVWEGGGNLGDVAAIVHDPVANAEVWSKVTSRPQLREFLQGLIPLCRRQPDYLASSQNRLSLLALSRAVSALLAPAERRVSLAQVIRERRSVIFHLPQGAMGEGPSLFVANLLLSRLFVSLLRDAAPMGDQARCLVLLDEMQSFSPPLVRELLESGRKFGVGTVFATQSAERLEGTLGASLIASVGTLLVLRTPQPSATKVTGLLVGPARKPAERESIETTLETLPDHTALVRSHGHHGLSLVVLPAPVPSDAEGWKDSSDRSAREFGNAEEEWEREEARIREILLRAAMGEPRARSEGDPNRPTDGPGAEGQEALHARAVERGWLSRGPHGTLTLSESGWARLGLREESGAPRESRVHRGLVAEAFRLFARNGVRLELPLQGRFDARLPDARARQFQDEGWERWAPCELRRRIEGLAGSWLWRLGHGRDVHVEAEVSSLREPARLRRSMRKARDAGAFLLFVTTSSKGGRVLRECLAREGWGPEQATVWVLRLPPDAGRGTGLSETTLCATA